MFYDWNFARIAPYWKAFGVGVVVTIELTVVIVLLGCLVGIPLGILQARQQHRWFLAFAVDLVRSVPLLVLILLFYFVLTEQIIGVAVSSFWVFSIAMSLSMAAFTADIVRSAVIGVPFEAIDAGRALGLSESQIARHISRDYVIRQVIPGMSVLVIATLKNSSLAATINVGELLYSGQSVLAETARSLEVWVVVGVLYTALVLPTTYASRRLEAWARRGTRSWIG